MNRKQHEATNIEYRRLILTLRAATGLPLAWSAITGAFSGFFAGSLAYVAGGDNPVALGLVAGSAMAFLAWIWAIRWWLSIWENQQIEKIKQQPPIEWTKRDSENPNVMKRAQITTANHEQLGEVAKLIHRGRTISSDTLSKIFYGSRPRTNAFRDEMVENKFLEWKNPLDRKSGLVVTRLGHLFLADYLPEYLRREALLKMRQQQNDIANLSESREEESNE